MSDIVEEEALRQDINKHYENLEFNEFDEGIPVAECNQNRRILLKNLPDGLTRHAIRHNILGQFGEVVSMNIPESLAKNGCQWVFAEFSKFAEAETAIRELNNVKIDKCVIQAMFAHDKKLNHREVETDAEAMIKPPIEFAPIVEVEPEPLPAPITVAFNVPDDDIYEKVTDFFRQKPSLDYKSMKNLEALKRLAEKSEGTYNPETGILTYNGALFDDGSPLCCNCVRMALLRCEDTGRYFCSIKCNRDLLDPVRKVEPALKRNEIVFGERLKVKDEVFISAIINEKCLYVKRMDEDCKTLNDLIKAAKHPEKLKTTPAVGDLLLVRFMDDFHRAKVLKVTDFAITVQLYDIGNTARVSNSDLYAMSKKCQRIPCVAHKVILKNVDCGLVNLEIVTFLTELLQSRTSLTIKQLEDNHVVLVGQVNVNEEVETKAMVEDATYNVASPIIDDLAPGCDIIPDGNNQRLFVLNSKISKSLPGSIVCISEDNYKDLIQLYKAIDAYARNRTTTDYGVPHKNGVFLAFCNGQWHRAIIAKSSGDGAPLCHLIDLLSDQRVKVKNMIPMPSIFSFPPVMSQICDIEGCEGYQGILESLENSWILADEVKNEERSLCKIKVSTLFKNQDPKSDGSSQRTL